MLVRSGGHDQRLRGGYRSREESGHETQQNEDTHRRGEHERSVEDPGAEHRPQQHQPPPHAVADHAPQRERKEQRQRTGDTEVHHAGLDVAVREQIAVAHVERDEGDRHRKTRPRADLRQPDEGQIELPVYLLFHLRPQVFTPLRRIHERFGAQDKNIFFNIARVRRFFNIRERSAGTAERRFPRMKKRPDGVPHPDVVVFEALTLTRPSPRARPCG